MRYLSISLSFSRINVLIKIDLIVTDAEFDRDLAKDVVSDTSGHLRRLLQSVCTAGREQSTEVDFGKSLKDAQDIYAVLIQSFYALHHQYTVLCQCH